MRHVPQLVGNVGGPDEEVVGLVGVALTVMHADGVPQGLAVAGLGVVYVALGVMVDWRWRAFVRRAAAG